jgi:hypothetical protein
LRNARVSTLARFIEHTEYRLCCKRNAAIFSIQTFSCEELQEKVLFELYQGNAMATMKADILKLCIYDVLARNIARVNFNFNFISDSIDPLWL